MRRLLVLAVVVLGLSSTWAASRGQDTDGPASKKPETSDAWSADDLVNFESAGGFQIAPDGKHAVWVKKSPDKEKGIHVGQLMLSTLADGKELQLTRGQHSASSPQWSPDGKLIAFISSRPAPKGKRKGRDDDDKDEPRSQIWLINPFGGEPWVLTESPRDVRGFGWSDSDTIVFFAQEKTTLREKTLKDKKDGSLVGDDEANEPPVRLWTVGLKSKKAERFTTNSDRVQSLAIAPDGRHAVTIHNRSLSYTFDNRIKPAVFLYDPKSGERKQLFLEGRYNISGIHWQPDSSGFYAVSQFTTHPRYLMAYINDVYHYDVESGKTTPVSIDWPKGVNDWGGEGFQATCDGFIALLADGVRHKLARYTRDGDAWKRSWIDKENVHALIASKDGKTLICEESTGRNPPTWKCIALEGSALGGSVLLADMQADLRKKPRAHVEVVKWKGALKEEVEGLLYLPLDYKDGQKRPLVVLIHGGPFWADFDQWSDNWVRLTHMLCARGAVVFKPNYHGSSNYGLPFAESIANGKYYSLPIEDIEKGIDHLVARGVVDPNKVGLTGWSNGAILTMALITRRPYQAAVAGAGGSEWVADWGVCEFGKAFDDYYFGKSPYEDPELYRKLSPFFDFPKVRTPTLLLHGTEDRDVPSMHGWMQFRALQQLGKEVRLVYFPGEKHGLTRLALQKRKVEEELAWFDRHLFQSVKDTHKPYKDDSPLALALALKKVARDGRLYGLGTSEGVLIPEVATYKGLDLGRFEVTRAQFQAFDKKYDIEPGTENYPANGISFEQAKAYCAWLSKVAGEEYRLGTVAELEEIYQEVDGPENTLDFWAGHDVNPEDRAGLLKNLGDLTGKAPLLKEVGSFKSASAKTPIFDLGGNVSEWAVDEKGRGRLLGGSADQPAEERGKAATAYSGFRVLRARP